MKDALGDVQSLLVLGGGSDIALATAKVLAGRRCSRVILAARQPESLADAVAAVQAAGASDVEAVAFDAADTDSHEAFVADMFDRYGDFDVVLFAWGVLGSQERASADRAHAVEIVRTNFVGAISVSVPIVDRLTAQGHGTIVVLSSVAGERVRAANFTYGSSKAGLDGYFQGLADSLVGSGVHVMIVRPGFVVSKMTEGMEAAPLSTTPEAVAAAIAKGLARGTEIVWVPGALRFVMSGLRHVPRPIFRRLPV